MTFWNDQLLVRASIGAREVWALLDSGAGITTVDATMPAGESFKPAIEVQGGGATQKIKLGFGALSSISLGGLRARDVPAASVPIPALEAFGLKRPELILGYSFFAAAAVRVDYKKGEIVFARSAGGLAAPSARRIPVRNVNGMLLADGEVEGHPAIFQIDTGSSGTLDVVKRWAGARGIPSETKTVTVRGRFGAGTAETTATYFRLGRGSLGPIRADGLLARVTDPPDHGDVAGLAGNGVLGRCDAVVFDHPGRSLLVEGACDRPVREHKMGWRLSKKPDPAAPDRPWVIATVWPGGAAEKAGLAPGDRVLEVGGKPATLDLEPISRIEEQAAGTKVTVVYARGEGASAVKKTAVCELAPLLPPRRDQSSLIE
jgi:membrane-associated protease RseP (regulator of RpoE activity)